MSIEVEKSLQQLERRARLSNRLMVAGVVALQLTAVATVLNLWIGSPEWRLVSGLGFTLGATLFCISWLMRNEDQETLELLKARVKLQEAAACTPSSAPSSVAEAVRAKSPVAPQIPIHMTQAGWASLTPQQRQSLIQPEVPPGWKVSYHGSNGSAQLSPNDPSNPS